MRPRPAHALPGAALLLAAAACAACGGGEAAPGVPGGDAAGGPAAIEAYGCGACHTIEGVRGADARVGPPLDDLASRRTIAGLLPNTPENLIRWIRFPQSVKPGTVMPDLGVGDEQARDIVAYLYRH